MQKGRPADLVGSEEGRSIAISLEWGMIVATCWGKTRKTVHVRRGTQKPLPPVHQEEKKKLDHTRAGARKSQTS